MPLKKIILGFAGPICSGKDILAEKLATHYLHHGLRVSIIKNSNLLKDIFTALSIKPARHDFSNLTMALKQIFGDDIISRTVAKCIAGVNSDVVLWSGLRTEDDWQHLVELKGKLIFVDADAKIRHERLLSRRRDQGDQFKSLDEFFMDEGLPTESYISRLKSKASLTIKNEGPIESSYNTLLNYTNSIFMC